MPQASPEHFLSKLKTISKLPHPYLALEKYVISLAKPPVRPIWAQAISITLVIISGIMLIASLWICAIRLKLKRFTLGHITKDRCVRPNPAICMATGSAAYYICEIVHQMTMLLGEHDITNTGGRLTLCGVKFMFMWLAVWCFAWGVMSHHICNIWNPPSQRNVPQNVKTRVPPLVAYLLNLAFFAFTSIAVIFVIFMFTWIDVEERNVTKGFEPVEAALRDLDQKGPVGFNLKTVLHTIHPLGRLYPLTVRLIYRLKIAIAGWISFGLLLSILQGICIYLILAESRRTRDSFNFRDSITAFVKKDSQSACLIDYRREQSIHFLISIVIIIATCVYMPLATYFCVKLSPKELSDVKLSLAMDIPPSCCVGLITSICVVLTLTQTLRIQKSLSMTRASMIIPTEGSQESSSHQLCTLLRMSKHKKESGSPNTSDFNSNDLSSLEVFKSHDC
ncbi:hypothetical protein DFH28DRAFT_203095 [Melampsora americana]|nr:hypothetical protein DFH28DRAFT_203095 [Melampsora americana]